MGQHCIRYGTLILFAYTSLSGCMGFYVRLCVLPEWMVRWWNACIIMGERECVLRCDPFRLFVVYFLFIFLIFSNSFVSCVCVANFVFILEKLAYTLCILNRKINLFFLLLLLLLLLRLSFVLSLLQYRIPKYVIIFISFENRNYSEHFGSVCYCWGCWGLWLLMLSLRKYVVWWIDDQI